MQEIDLREQPPPAKRSAASVAMALLPVAACLLGGSTEKWAEGVIVFLLGVYLLLWPPQFSLGLTTNLVLLAFCLFGAVAFLPSHMFFQPAWRAALTDDFGIRIAPNVTPQPWVSASCLISLVAGLSWLYATATLNAELRTVRFQLRIFAAGIALLAMLCVLLSLAHISVPFWHNARNYGPFPNRNQTGNLFALTAIVILACGQDELRKGRRGWIFWLIALAIVIVALILTLSRAGILILVIGSAIWLAIFALRQRSISKIALGLSFLLLLLTFLLVFGGETLERFHLRNIANTGISTDFRWRIFRDAFDLIRNSPWCGIGLGNFDPIFAIFRNASFGDTRALHPESDWLWLWSEMGWPALVCALIGLILIVRRAFPLQEGTNQRLRLATLIASLLFAIHGAVDVSGHRIGSAFAAILLIGLSVHRPLALKSSRLIPVFFRLVAIGLIVIGLSWVIAGRAKKMWPGSIAATSARQLATTANRDRDFAESIRVTTNGLNFAPLDWQLYFARALAEVSQKQYDAAVDDFRRARFLEPNVYEVPLAEGKVWISSHPELTATAWREAIRRARDRRRDVFSGMLTNESLQNPQIAPILEEVGLSQPDLTLAYLSSVGGETFHRALQRFLKSDPELHSLSDPEKLAFFVLWSERGQLDELVQTIQKHPDWKRYAWYGLAKSEAARSNFQSAYQITKEFGDPVAMPRISGNSSLEELEKRYASNPDNYAAGLALYHEQLRLGRTDDALSTVRHFTERPGGPAYFHYLEAEGWASKGNWERAWNAWLAYRAASKK